LPYIKECIHNAFAKEGAALLQTYLVKNITDKGKVTLVKVFGNSLFSILCKRSRNPILVSPATDHGPFGSFDSHGYTFYGIENDKDDVDLSDIPDDITHVERGIAHYKQLITQANSGAAGAAGDLDHAKIQLKRFKQKRQQLLELLELEDAKYLSMQGMQGMQGGKKLIHKNKRSSKSSKRSKSMKKKRSKSMKRK
jgi:hypothetical protein